MKKCPYCAEDIQDEAIVCRYCGRDLPIPPNVKERPLEANVVGSPKQIRKAPPFFLSLVLGIFLLFLIYGGAFLIVWFWTGPSYEINDVLVRYHGVSMFIITLLAVPGYDPNKKGCFQYILIFILSQIPIVNWFVVYWAGKSVARWLTEQ